MEDQDIKTMIEGAVSELKTTFSQTIENMSCTSNCPITPETAGEMDHFFGMVKDVGEGDLRKGVEEFRDNHKFITRMKIARHKISDWISKTIIVTVIAGLLTVLALGIKDYFK